MPKGFSEKQKETIRAKLLEKGRECLATYGIKKTNVEDLTKAAGISKGAFYLFFNSKEELFLEVLEQYEAEMRDKIFEFVMRPKKSPKQNVKAMLSEAFAFWESTSFLTNFKRDDFETLLLKVSPDRVMAHIRRDDAFVANMMEKWKREGLKIRQDPKAVSGLMKALFFVSLHKDDFGSDTYPDTMDLLIDLVSEYLTKE